MSTKSPNKFDINEIQKEASHIDSEELQLYLLEQVSSGICSSYFEALLMFCEEHDIETDDSKMLKKYISPSLYQILYKEAMDQSLLKNKSKHKDIIDFF